MSYGVAEAACFASDRQDWGTPWPLFERLNAEFGFTLDVCATADNAKCDCYYRPEDDGLSLSWATMGAAWMNPPYGRGTVLHRWIAKAHAESQRGQTVVCLVPSRTDTRWWHDHCMKGEVRFIRGRVKFEGARYNAPFPSAVVIFRGEQP